jgi:hypothetical protein
MALPGMLVHQRGSRHQWVPGKWWDPIVTMDEASGEHYPLRNSLSRNGTSYLQPGVRKRWPTGASTDFLMQQKVAAVCASHSVWQVDQLAAVLRFWTRPAGERDFGSSLWAVVLV